MSTHQANRSAIQPVSIGALVLLSGLCSLTYEIVWLREFRLVFGGTTAASAAVFAVFMGGLGFGGLYFGRRSDVAASPLRLYGWLELGSAGLALASLPLIALVHAGYVRTGGQFTLGHAGATVLRIALVGLTIGPCAFLMGGTLPTAVKFLQRTGDARRRGAALLYGINALGAVCGSLAATFWCLEHLGSKATLTAAGLLNVVLGIVALRLGRTARVARATSDLETSSRPTDSSIDRAFRVVIAFSFLSGFAFFVMELVWIRMLTPLMGGSVYVGGVMLGVILAGISFGGFAYSWRSERRVPSFGELAVSLALLSGALAIPLALGDHVAIWAFHLNKFRESGFSLQVAAWIAIASILVLIPSLLAGYQFPLFIGLLGSGNRDVGRHTGLAYAVNTLGAISGSLAGGLLFLPSLGAVTLWKTVVAAGIAMSLVALAISWTSAPRVRPLGAGLTLIGVVFALSCIVVEGPTAVWRHTPIGYGSRVEDIPTDSISKINWMRANRFALASEYEGRESHIGIETGKNGLSLYVNGKSDGSARGDAGTVVMLGMIGALLHERPERACVIGLGTGSTAGWLADVPGMEQVDVVEIEPHVVAFARRCETVNRSLFDQKNVNVLIGDGREALLTRPDTYDLIVSEPSNPYRSGIANLYTRDFYRVVRQRINPGGMFLQWIQAYETDMDTIMLLYRTLRSVFPFVQTWQAGEGDIVFQCHQDPATVTLKFVEGRMKQPIFREALEKAWLADSQEAFWGHFLCTSEFSDMASRQGGPINTDDRNILEFRFARNLSRNEDFRPWKLRSKSLEMGTLGPPLSDSELAELNLEKLTMESHYLSRQRQTKVVYSAAVEEETASHIRAAQAWERGDLNITRQQWIGAPSGLRETIMMAEAWADGGDDRASALISKLSQTRPVEAKVFKARLCARQGDLQKCVNLLKDGFEGYRSDPWPLVEPMKRALELAIEVNADAATKEISRELFDALELPFSLDLLERSRLSARIEIAKRLDDQALLSAVEGFGVHFPWTRRYLTLRHQAYSATDHPGTETARLDLERLAVEEGRRLLTELRNE